MIIEINDISIDANLKKHYPWEKSDIQNIAINCKIEYSEIKNIQNLSDVIDYVKVENLILDIVKNKSFEIIESLASDICNKILDKFTQIINIEIKITKNNVLKNAKSVSITIKKNHINGCKVILCLGSNLGEKHENINTAYQKLCEKLELKLPKISTIYENPAWFPKGSPKDWDIPFLNCAISGFCNKTPDEIMEICQKIEIEIGRKAVHEKYSPRIIDIDILYYNGQIVSTKNIQIPHSKCYFRDFMLIPAMEIEGDLVKKI